MAKGVEDTAFYLYNRLVSLNEVGGDPAPLRRARRGVPRENARAAGALAATRCWPPSTHDTKRSEDVRARHRRALRDARRVAGGARALARRSNAGSSARSTGAAGARSQRRVPALPDAARRLAGERRGRAERAARRLRRADRGLHAQGRRKEAKVHTSWINPDTAYEAALQRFVTRAARRRAAARVPGRPRPFARGVAAAGAVNCLAQTLLKLDRPGRARHLPGHRAVGPDAWSTPTTAARSTSRGARRRCSRSTRRWRRVARASGSRPTCWRAGATGGSSST